MSPTWNSFLGIAPFLLSLPLASAAPQATQSSSSAAPADSQAIASAHSAAGVSVPPTSFASTQVVATGAPDPSSIVASFPSVSLLPSGGLQAAKYFSPAHVPNGAVLSPALSQNLTNGASVWGTGNATTYPKFLSGHGEPLPNGQPWGNAGASDTNYYDLAQIPNTGVTRTYEFTVASATISPDGVKKPGLVINGGFPGPLIEANWGDWITVNVKNDLPTEGTGLHWHGLLQQGTQYMDGVPSVGQCPIAPGSSFQYTFRADLYGSSWYHSHYSAQYAGGAIGPMIIHGPLPGSIDYDTDIGPVILSDWYHQEYFSIVEQVMSPISAGFGPPLSNNNLINGKMNYPCANTTLDCTPNAGIAKFNFTSTKKYRLRLINTSAEAIQKFTIDGHNMTVFANDFVQIEPYTTNVVTLGVGQRSDVVVEAVGQPTDVYWMRANISGCSTVDGISPVAVAAIYYEDANQTAVPTSQPSWTEEQLTFCGNDDLTLTQPYLPLTPAPNPATQQDFNITLAPNATGFNVWEMNGQTFRADYNDPVLLEAKLGTTDFDPEWNVYNFGSNDSIRMVVYNYFQAPHPMHLHGHNMYVLQEGTGIWDGSVTHADNPQRRDVQIVHAAVSATEPAYIVLQIDADNPGVWPFHCHIAWHVSAGLYVNVLERPADITEQEIPMVLAQTCRDWWAFTDHNVVDQIDSGL